MSSLHLLGKTTLIGEIPTELSALPAPHPCLQATVIIPARDEASNIEGTLAALANQLNGDGTRFQPERYEIILGCNNCRDETAAIARQWGETHPEVCLHVVESTSDAAHANVGWARRTLMAAAYQRLSALAPSKEPRAMCSTDADTRVFPHWLSATLAEMAAGAEAVGGRIYVERGDDAAIRRTYLLDTAYRLYAARLESVLDPQNFDPWPRHFQFFGASLAVRPETYALVGGLPDVPCLEDVALERELRRCDVPVRHSPHVAVLTSSRACGRVQTGLSTQLQEWQRLDGQNWLVPSGREIEFRTRARRRLRRLFGAFTEHHEARDWKELAQVLLLDAGELRERTESATHFGALWEDVWDKAWSNEALREQWRPIPVEVAIQELRLALCNVYEK